MTVTHDQLAERHDRGKRFREIEKKLDDVADDMKTVLEILEALDGLKTLGKLSAGIAKWLITIGGAIGGAISIAWLAFKLAVGAAFKG